MLVHGQCGVMESECLRILDWIERGIGGLLITDHVFLLLEKTTLISGG